MTGVATAIGVGAAVTAGAAVYSSNQQAGAAKNAQNIAQNQYQNTVALESPYNKAGVSDLNELNYLMGTGPKTGQGINPSLGGYGSLNQSFNTSDWKSLSPAYGFQLQQGQQGVLNQDAGSQGAESGAALKDLISYNQGMANSSFNNAFNMYQTQQQNTYNRLANVANLGQSAASGTAQTGASLANTAATAAQNVGTAQAGGTVGLANSLSGGGVNSAIWAQYGGGGSSGSPSADFWSYGGAGSPNVATSDGGLP